MKRRIALKSLAASFGALVILPAWAENWTLPKVMLKSPLLNPNQADLLTDVVATIIPEGTIPGAKALGVPAFIQKMIADCYEKTVQEDFKNGLDTIEKTAQQTYSQAFANLAISQKQDLLKSLGASTDSKTKEFYSAVKSLTIQGYTTSEYVMVKHLKYVMAPGHYYGCVQV